MTTTPTTHKLQDDTIAPLTMLSLGEMPLVNEAPLSRREIRLWSTLFAALRADCAVNSKLELYCEPANPLCTPHHRPEDHRTEVLTGSGRKAKQSVY